MTFIKVTHNHPEVEAEYNSVSATLSNLYTDGTTIIEKFTNTNSKLSQDLKNTADRFTSVMAGLEHFIRVADNMTLKTENLVKLTNKDGVHYSDMLIQLIMSGDKRRMIVVLTELTEYFYPLIERVKRYGEIMKRRLLRRGKKTNGVQLELIVHELQKMKYRDAIQAMNNPLPYLR